MSDEYIDSSFDEADSLPVSNPRQLYDDVPGMSGPAGDTGKAEGRIPITA